ncbi:MAG: HDOD domain-containing protein [Deltaproteobacteria bacterium]|nr:HDOD domain-containing protein [Deltaproteobacteria bacterium]
MTQTSLAGAQSGERPVSSGAAARIVQTALAPDCSLPELAKLAESDPAFAIRVLSVVNSAAFGLSCQVGDVKRAVGLLGVRGLRNLALGFIVTSMVPSGELGTLILAQALRRATASRAVAQALGERRADEAFTVGLLLECGLMNLASEDAEIAQEVVRAPAAHRSLREKALGPRAASRDGRAHDAGIRPTRRAGRGHRASPRRGASGRPLGARRVAGRAPRGPVRRRQFRRQPRAGT